MRYLYILLAAVLACSVCPTSVLAGQSTATATVSATVPAITVVSLDRDVNSVTRGTATQILFDKLDCQDMPNGDCGFMYAPYRSEVNKNWHVAEITATGSTMSLGVAVSGSIGAIQLSSILKLWCGGFYPPGATIPIPGTQSTNWEYAQGFQRSLNQAFVGTAPFNYQLDVSSVGAGSYAGSITFTLTTT